MVFIVISTMNVNNKRRINIEVMSDYSLEMISTLAGERESQHKLFYIRCTMLIRQIFGNIETKFKSI